MLIRFNLPRNRRITFTWAKIEDQVGFNSRVSDGLHCLVWDFDDIDRNTLLSTLRFQQVTYSLPEIQIYKSRKDVDNYHAVCFKLLPWEKVVSIVAATPFVDWGFVKWGVMRGYFTLRMSPRNDSIPFLYAKLPSDTPSDCGWRDLTSFAFYETVEKK